MEALRSSEELETLTAMGVLQESLSIPRSSPRTFSLISLSLVFPLSFAILVHTLFTHPLLHHLQQQQQITSPREWTLLFLYQFLYLLFLFTFSLLSTAAIVFSVASLYSSSTATNRTLSFSSVFSAIPPVFSRLLLTFLWVAAIMASYHLAFVLSILLLFLFSSTHSPFFLPFLLLLLSAFLAIHVYISAVWHLASVVTVLEPLSGLAAMRKSCHLLRGRTSMATRFVLAYLFACGLLSVAFRFLVVLSHDRYAILTRVAVGAFLVAALALVNFVGLLLQSVFYYVCKSFHRQPIDRAALSDHLGGYLGEYVPLKSSIQMENL